MRTRLTTALLAGLMCTLLAACNNDDLSSIKDPGRAPLPAPLTNSPENARSNVDRQMPSATTTTGIDKVLVTIVENKGIAQMQKHAPKLWALSQKYGYASDFRAITHPSLPNYISISAGDQLGVKDDKDPSKHTLTAPNIFTNTLQAGGTAQTFADNMGEPCRQTNKGKYAVRHNPWTYFVNDRANCQKFDVDAAAFAPTVAAGNLANLTFLIPDNCHNAHDCSIETADNWVSQAVAVAMSGPDFRSGRLLIIVTADEDEKKEGNRILTAVIHPTLSKKLVSTRLTHFSLNKLLAQITHTAPLRNGVTAPDMASAFGLTIRPAAATQPTPAQ